MEEKDKAKKGGIKDRIKKGKGKKEGVVITPPAAHH